MTIIVLSRISVEKSGGGGIVAHCYDYSTLNFYFANPEIKKLKRFFKQILKGIITFNFISAKNAAKEIAKEFKERQNFLKFFDGKNNHFIPKFIGDSDRENYTCFDTIFKDLGELDDLSVFIKMDIERGEYFCLRDILPYSDKINGLAVEFHLLSIFDDRRFEKLTEALLDKFYVAHIHANNYCGFIGKSKMPYVPEITFINKELIREPVKVSTKSYPIAGLDKPNIPDREDLILSFDE